MADTAATPHAFVIFGATGDLARRKLLAALAGLCHQKLLHKNTFVLGAARRAMNDAGYDKFVTSALQASEFAANALCAGVHYQALSGDAASYAQLGTRLTALEKQYETGGNRLFYLALPATAFVDTIAALGKAGLHKSTGWTRIVVEKPFGVDLQSARQLIQVLRTYFDRSQVYLIDHFLGKETVQNLLAFRFANSIFESMWNREKISCVQITVAEELGLEGRAGYYEQAGALRDMVQNHLTQLVALVGMEVPAVYSAEDIRFEKLKLLRSIAPVRRTDAVFGQYSAGTCRNKQVPAYRDEEGASPQSSVETFVALRLRIANWRWQNVPFYVRTGKRMPRRTSEIAVAFRHPPASLFKSLGIDELPRNVLRFALQPDEGFALNLNVKVPGTTVEMRSLPLHFEYKEAFGRLADAYETLLFDVMQGDQSLFSQPEAVDVAWALYEPLQNGAMTVHDYAAGTWGPPQADGLLRAADRWLTE